MTGAAVRNSNDTRPSESAQSAQDAVLAHLLKTGQIDEPGLARAQRAGNGQDRALFSTIAQLGLVSEDVLADAFCSALGLERCARERLPHEPVVDPDKLSLRFLQDVKALPVELSETLVTVAFADPSDDYARRAVEWATGLTVCAVVALPSDIDAALGVLLSDQADTDEADSDDPAGIDGSEDADRLRDLASEAPVIRFVNRMLTEASENGASDIHIEPDGQGLRIRQRVDGLLRDMETPSPAQAAAVISRIKLMAHLDIAERRLPQDGRARFVVRGRAVDLRIATLPTLDRESVVIRILDRSQVSLDFSALGFTPDAISHLTGMLQSPNGIVFVTGPTGSGKTTTLYTGVKAINDPSKKIITVEDPIEYRLEGVNQVQVKPKIGLTFAKVLRSMLRQDPDVLMVGEIRDLETAEIAVQAALTGHLVLSTLHTNSAADTLTRLRDMGVEPYLLGSTILGVIAQRLVRTLCTQCREPAAMPLANPLGGAPVRVFEAKGCPSCKNTGFRGRSVIFEIMPMTAALRDAVVQGRAASDLASLAREHGMRTMLESGIAKVEAGETTLDEVLRATREI